MKNGFTTEETELFERRFIEGYDLFIDERYVEWMERMHPNSLPANLRQESSHSFSSKNYDVSQPATESEEIEHTTSTSLESDPITLSVDGRSQTQITSYATDVAPTEPNRISKYLTIPTLSQKPKKSNSQTGARIVTSHEFIAELREKEEKKKQAEEEKRQRKLERERKKKEKEAKKEQTMKQKQKRLKQKQKRLKQNQASKGKSPIKAKQNSESKCTPTTTTKLNTRKRTKSIEVISSDDEIDENTCCVCFDEYHSDEEWIQCSCSRWLHEDCSLSEIPNALETCPHCVL